jgi:hypothetical protein
MMADFSATAEIVALCDMEVSLPVTVDLAPMALCCTSPASHKPLTTAQTFINHRDCATSSQIKEYPDSLGKDIITLLG